MTALRWTHLGLFALSVSALACDDGSDSAGDAASVDAAADDVAASVDATDRDAADADEGDDGGTTPFEMMRAACRFQAGARVADTLGLGPTARARLPIKNIIISMKENRSFDHILGRLHESGQPATDAIPDTFVNRDLSDALVAPFHAPTTCMPYDPDHQWEGMHAQINGGKMDGFVTTAAKSTHTDGHLVMAYNDATDLPFYYWMANTFALEDRHFASARSGTYPNQNFLVLGTADGVRSTGGGLPQPDTKSIFDLLDERGISWGVYNDGDPFFGGLGWQDGHPGLHVVGEFISALDDGTLPQVTFVEARAFVLDEHPTADVQRGEAWTRMIYEHVVASRLWPGIAMIWTYDEAGGLADHVPPPEHACVARPGATDAPFFELGARVPFVMVSPWARPHAVSHVVEDHTAITRFIETVFDLPALTARDANSAALLDLFDFEGAAGLLAPGIPPAAGTGRCAGTVVLTTDKPIYAAGEPVVTSFINGPGRDPRDRIAVYTYPASGPTLPNPTPVLVSYIGGTQTPTTAPASASVIFDQSKLGVGPWPLPSGLYIAYYLPAGSYLPLASIDFKVR